MAAKSSKIKTLFACSECGAEAPKWAGRCTECGDWNTLVEELAGGPAELALVPLAPTNRSGPTRIGEIGTDTARPISTGIDELDTVLGGGLVAGSVTLLGGEPGIGKSTLLLQLLAARTDTTLYVSAEESATQVRLRAERLDAIRPNLWLHAETSLPHVLQAIDQTKPELVVIDSIQTMVDPELSSAPGSVGQVRGCAHRLVNEAKERNIAVVLVGHVTKDGNLAGPRVLEHVVDTVLQFEGDRHHALRLLRAREAPFRADQRVGPVRDGRRRPRRRARSVHDVPRRSSHRHPGLGGRADHGGSPPDRRRTPGVDLPRPRERAEASQRGRASTAADCRC